MCTSLYERSWWKSAYWILNIKSLLVIWFKILDLCFHTLVSSNRFIILCRLLQNSQTEHRKGHRTVFLSLFYPTAKKAVGVLFSPMVSGLVGWWREKVFPVCISSAIRCTGWPVNFVTQVKFVTCRKTNKDRQYSHLNKWNSLF